MEKVFLVGTHLKNLPRREQNTSRSLDELARLAETAGGTVVGRAVQEIAFPNASTFIGSGKVEELREKAAAKEFSTLIFDDELKPAQQKNLAEMVPCKIVDRTRLILDIFAKRARTREGRLQVELAQLSYMLPRMTERYGRFEQQVGGIGTRGPGERKLEVEARHIRDRTAQLRREIEDIKMHREVARERRRSVPLPIVTIVGYTNAGKSTLLNKLVQLYGQNSEKIYADDKLFATLDPTTRRVRLPNGRWALFTDTVGFISKLPHHLIAAFRSTLEEALDADALIHLIDAGSPTQREETRVVLETLKQLEEDGKKSYIEKIIPVFNKIDLVPGGHARAAKARNAPEAPLRISAVKGTGVQNLLNRVEKKLSGRLVEADLFLPFEHSGILSSLYRLGEVESVASRKHGTRVRVRLEQSHLNKIQKTLENGVTK